MIPDVIIPNEAESRRPNWPFGELYRLGDGDYWCMPVPRIIPRVLVLDTVKTVATIEVHGVADLMIAEFFTEAETRTRRARIVLQCMTLTHLLMLNYDIDADAALQLVVRSHQYRRMVKRHWHRPRREWRANVWLCGVANLAEAGLN